MMRYIMNIKFILSFALCVTVYGTVFANRLVTKMIGDMPVTIGSPKIPVILVQFSDLAFSENDPKTAYEQRLCAAATQEEVENGYGTAAQYFADQSAGNFTPEFVVIGPVTLSGSYATYGADGTSTDTNVGSMITETIELAAATGQISNWLGFDINGDSICDGLYLIYAGEGQHALPSQTDLVWPHTSTLSERNMESPVVDNLKFNNYSCTNELLYGEIDGIGTFCHEFSHQLGLPDFYRTDGASVTVFTMGSWSVMDYGSYCLDGKRPVGFRALEKAHLGWLELIELDEATTVVNMPSTDQGGGAFKVANSAKAAGGNEYLVLETIDDNGWNKSCVGKGLLVTYVCLPDMSVWYDNTVNNTAVSTYRVHVVPADNDPLLLITGQNEEEYEESLAGDTYPYGDNNQLTDSSTPSTAMQYGLSGKLNKPITSITYNAETQTVSFQFMGGSSDNVITGITSINTNVPEGKTTEETWYTIDGVRVENPTNKGIYILRDAAGNVTKRLIR